MEYEPPLRGGHLKFTLSTQQSWTRKTWLPSKRSFVSSKPSFHCYDCWQKIRKMWVFPKIGVPPKSSILIGFFIINHPFWGGCPRIFGNTHVNFHVNFLNDSVIAGWTLPKRVPIHWSKYCHGWCISRWLKLFWNWTAWSQMPIPHSTWTICPQTF